MDTNEITADLALGGPPIEQAFVRILKSTPIQMLQKTTATKIESLVHQLFRIPYLFDDVFRKLDHVALLFSQRRIARMCILKG